MFSTLLHSYIVKDVKFTEIYWNLIQKHHILQKNPGKCNRRSVLESILLDAKERYAIAEGIPFESLTGEMRIDICHRVKMKCKENVVGALYADLGGLLYSFSKSGQWIQLNPIMYEFVCKHKVAIEKINYYEWARFLEDVDKNATLDHLLTNIDESTLRTRKSLEDYRDILFQEFENKCFYCGKEVRKDSVHVDHFVPWSFIKDDQLWNFVLACPSCNTSKSDKLAQDMFLNKIVRRNQIWLEKNKRVFPIDNADKRIQVIYTWAQKNGYNDIWVPKTVVRSND